MAYASWSVVFGEQPTAAKWNILGTNDASFNDGTGIGSGVITNAKLLLTGSQRAVVTTSQTTTSTSATDLATPGPAVTVTVGASGIVFICISTRIYNSTAAETYMGYALSGANTVSPATYSDTIQNTGTNGLTLSFSKLLTGLSTGSTTFTAKYWVSGGTGTFEQRVISVIPI